MTAIELVIVAVVGAAAGAAAVHGWARGRLAAGRAEVARLEQVVEHERALSEEKTRHAEEVRGRLGEAVEAAAARAFTGRHQEFLALAGEKLAPFHEKIDLLDRHLRDFDSSHRGAFGSITEMVRGLSEANERLTRETGKLVTALRKPQVRGRWGEMALRNAVEAAGMTAYCDFAEQVTVRGEVGRLRPDLVVSLPGGRQVVVDAKVPLEAYLDALEATDEATQAGRLTDHAGQLRRHVQQLGAKGYAEQFAAAPECVVLFVPAESMLSVALDRDPSLFEEAAAHRVLLATPTTLLGILFAVAHVWRQEAVAENAQRISETGKELYRRLATMGGHFSKLGRAVETVAKAYNETVGSLETRVLPAARRFEELGAATGGLDDPTRVEVAARALSSPELTGVVELDVLRPAAESGT